MFKKLRSELVPCFLTVGDGDVLADATLDRFAEETGKEPFFRISITPAKPKLDLVDVGAQSVRELLIDPPGSRRAGWNMESGSFRIDRFEEGVRRGTKDFEYLELLSNGYMEFWTPLKEHFCWRQSPEEFRTRPSLYPIPVKEYPATFLLTISSACQRNRYLRRFFD